jgi:hypothetical protein
MPRQNLIESQYMQNASLVPTSYNNFFNGEEGNGFVNNPARFSNDCEIKAAQDKSTGNQVSKGIILTLSLERGNLSTESFELHAAASMAARCKL